MQCRKSGFDPWVRKTPWRRKWQPTPVFLPGEFHAQRSLVGYSPWESMGGINQQREEVCCVLGFFTRTKPAGFGSTPSVSELFLSFSVFLFYNLKVTFLKLSKQFSWWAFSHGSRISRHGFYVSFLHKLHKKPNIFLRQQFSNCRNKFILVHTGQDYKNCSSVS